METFKQPANNTNFPADWDNFFVGAFAAKDGAEKTFLSKILSFLMNYADGSTRHSHNQLIHQFVQDTLSDPARNLGKAINTLEQRLKKAEPAFNPTGSLAKRLAYINFQLDSYNLNDYQIKIDELCGVDAEKMDSLLKDKITAALRKNTAKPEWKKTAEILLNAALEFEDQEILYTAAIAMLKTYCSYDSYFTKTTQFFSWSYHAPEIKTILDREIKNPSNDPEALLQAIAIVLKASNQHLKPDGELVKILKFISERMKQKPVNQNDSSEQQNYLNATTEKFNLFTLCLYLSHERIQERQKEPNTNYII